MNNLVNKKNNILHMLTLLNEEYNLAYVNNSKSKKYYIKMSKLLYDNPENMDIKNKFKIARKSKEQNEKKLCQLFRKLDLNYKNNRKIIFVFPFKDELYIKYSFLTNEIFVDNIFNGDIVLPIEYSYDNLKLIDEFIIKNNLETIDEVKTYFNNKLCLKKEIK